MKALLAALLLAIACIHGALAHVTSTGLAVLEVNDGRLAYRLTLVATEQEEEMAPPCWPPPMATRPRPPR